MLDLLDYGVHLVFADSDLVWLNDPREFFDKH